MKKYWAVICLVLIAVCLAGTAAASEVFSYTVTPQGEAVITEYMQDAAHVELPREIGGYPVTGIAGNAFAGCDGLESVMIPGRVVSIDENAFGGHSPEIRAYNGSFALEYADAQGLKAENLSELDFYTDVVDFTDAEWHYDGMLVMPPWEARRLEADCLVYLDGPAKDEIARSYRVLSLDTVEGSVRAEIELVEGPVAIRSMSVKLVDAPMEIVSVTPSEGVYINECSISDDDEEMTLKLNIPLDKHVNMDLTVTYKAVTNGQYDYSENRLPNGYMLTTETISIKGSLKASGKPLDLKGTNLDLQEIIKKKPLEDQSLLDIKLKQAGIINIEGKVSVSIEAMIAGTIDYTVVRERGTYVDGGISREVNHTVRESCTDFDVSGSLGLKIGGSIGMKVKGLGTIISMDISTGVTLSTKETDQYDDNIRCFDMELKGTGSLSLTVKLAVDLIKDMKFTFYEKKIPIMSTEVVIDTGHIEVSRGNLLEYELLDIKCLKECSIPEEVRRTVKFYTGTREKVEDQLTVVGQCITEPSVNDVNERVHFFGWLTERNGGQYFDFSQPLTADTARTMTLYADWSQPMRKVTIDFGWDMVKNIETYLVPGVLVEKPVIPMRMDYRFDGFYRAMNDGSGRVSLVKWTFEENTTDDTDLYLVGKWIYEKGYNPYQEIIDTYTGNEEVMNQLIKDTKYDLTASTGVQGALSANGITVDVCETLNNFYHLTDYSGASNTLVVPGKVNGVPVVYVDGTKFTNKQNLQMLVLPSSVMYVKGFNNFPNLQCVVFNSEVVQFTGRDSKEYTFPGLQVIANGAFANCPQLQQIDLPGTLRVIGSSAFSGSGLQYCTIPSGVTRLGKSMFENCADLHTVSLNTNVTHLPGSFFASCPMLNNVNLDHIRSVGNYALYKTGLETIALNNISSFGDGAVSGSANLKQLHLSAAAGSELYLSTKALGILPALEYLSISGDIDVLIMDGNTADNLQNIVIGGSLNYLSLENLPAIRSVTVNGSVETLSFEALPALEELYVDSMIEGTTYASLLLKDCPNLGDVGYSEPFPWRTRFEFDNINLRSIDLSTMTRPEDSTWLFSLKLANMAGLKRVAYPAGVTALPPYAFKNCPALECVDFLPDGLTTISERAFSDCPNLKKVILPDSVTTIGAYAFSGCTALESVVLPEGLASYENYTFTDCDSLGSIVFPRSAVSVNLSSYVDSESMPARVVIRNPEMEITLPADSPQTPCFVVVCAADSAARKTLDSVTSNPRCWLDINSADANRYVVRFTADGLLYSDRAYGRYNDGTVYELYSAGERVVLPGSVISNKNDLRRFAGWYLDSACTKPVDASFTMPARDITLYAGWTKADEGLTWEILENKAFITGYTGSEDTLVIPPHIGKNPVAGIRAGAFSDAQIRKLVLPETLEDLSAELFSGCAALESVYVCEGGKYTSVQGCVYALNAKKEPSELIFCPPMKAGKLEIPETVTVIRANACADCRLITDISVPASVKTLESGALAGCADAETIRFGADVELLYEDVLPDSFSLRLFGPVDAANLIAWAEASGVDYNMYRLFLAEKGPGIYIPVRAGEALSDHGMANTDTHIFEGWAEEPGVCIEVMPERDLTVYPVWTAIYTVADGVLTHVDARAGANLIIPADAVSIAAGAVTWKADSVYIPSGVTAIDDKAFAGVKTVIGDAGTEAEAFAARNGAEFRRAEYNMEFDTHGGAPIDPIAGYAGAEIELPVPVRTFADFAGWYLDGDMKTPFEGTVMPSGSTVLHAAWNTYPGLAIEFTLDYNDDGTVSVTGYFGENDRPELPGIINGYTVTAIAAEAFSGDTVIRSLEIPATVRTVGEGAFRNTAVEDIVFLGETAELAESAFEYSAALRDVTLPSALTRIPEHAFRGCESLISLSVPDTVTDIGAGAFYGCRFMEQFTLPAGIAQFDPAMLDGLWLKDIAVSENSAAYRAENGAVYTMDGTELVYLCRDVENTSLEVPEGVTAIGADALNGVHRLRALTLPEGLIRLGDRALSGLSISELVLPDSLTSIGTRGLNPAPYLETVTLPDSLTEIGDMAFDTGTDLHVSPGSIVAGQLAQFYHVIVDGGIEATDVLLTPTVLQIYVGDSAQIEGCVIPANADDTRLEWISADDSIAVVMDGNVIGVSAGETTVHAVNHAGHYAACAVTVKEKPVEDRLIVSVDSTAFVQDDGAACLIMGREYDLELSFASGSEIRTVQVSEPTGIVDIYCNSIEASISIPHSYYDENDEYRYTEDGTPVALTVSATNESGEAYTAQIVVVACDNAGAAGLPGLLEMYSGDTYFIPGAALPDNHLGRMGDLYSLNPAVATIDEDGFIHAVAPGVTVICREVGQYRERILLNVVESRCTLSIGVEDDVAFIGKAKDMKVVCSDPDAELTVESLDPNRLTVSGSTITASKSGIAGLRVSADRDGEIIAQATTYVYCGYAISEIGLSDMEDWELEFIIARKGEKLDLLDESYPYNAIRESVHWTVSDPEIATISKDGWLTGHATGRVTITGTRLGDGVTETAEAVVDVWDGEIYLGAESATVQVGGTVALIPFIDTEDPGARIEWETYGYGCLSVDENGIVTGRDDGSETITATLLNSSGYPMDTYNNSADIEITVLRGACAEDVKLPDQITIPVGTRTKVLSKADALPEGASLNTVADIQLTGNESASLGTYTSGEAYVLMSQPGTALLTVTMENGLIRECTIIAEYPEFYIDLVEPEDYSEGSRTICAGTSLQLEAIARCPNDYTVSWRVASGTNVFSVDQNGRLTAKTAGYGQLELKITDNVTGEKKTVYKSFVSVDPVTTLRAESDPAFVTPYDYAVIPLIVEGADPEDIPARAELENAGSDYYSGVFYDSNSGEWDESKLYIRFYSNGQERRRIKLTISNGAGMKPAVLELDVYCTYDGVESASMRNLTLSVGGKGTPEYWFASSDGYTVDACLPTTWSVEDDDIASVDENGVFTALSTGETTISMTAVLAGGRTVTATGTLTVIDVPWTSAELDVSELTMATGGTYYLNWTVTPSDDRAVMLTSSDPTVATVDQYGTIEALKPGTTTIELNGGSGAVARCVVKVTRSVEEIRVAGGENLRTMVVGQQLQLNAVALPESADNRTLSWESSNTGAAKVDRNGLVTAVGYGYTEIRISAMDDSYAGATVPVYVYKPMGSISSNVSSIQGEAGDTVQLVISGENGILPAYQLIFESTDQQVASVTSGGLVTCLSDGSAVIRVKTRDGSGSLTIRVQCGDAEPVIPAGTRLKLPEALTVIEAEAFADSAAFNHVIAGTALEEIGSMAFARCAGLKSISLPGENVAIAPDAFEGCAADLIVYCIPGSATWNNALAAGLQTANLN